MSTLRSLLMSVCAVLLVSATPNPSQIARKQRTQSWTYEVIVEPFVGLLLTPPNIRLYLTFRNTFDADSTLVGISQTLKPRRHFAHEALIIYQRTKNNVYRESIESDPFSRLPCVRKFHGPVGLFDASIGSSINVSGCGDEYQFQAFVNLKQSIGKPSLITGTLNFTPTSTYQISGAMLHNVLTNFLIIKRVNGKLAGRVLIYLRSNAASVKRPFPVGMAIDFSRELIPRH